MQVESAEQQLSELQATLQAHQVQCQQIQHDREDFDHAMNDTTLWLEEKEDILASLRPLHLDSEKVDPVVDRHEVIYFNTYYSKFFM